jgi:Ca2+-binding RTX toxin-like protein
MENGKWGGCSRALITDGETASSINEKGDLVSGNDGNDLVYGSNANDALLGGEGNKR